MISLGESVDGGLQTLSLYAVHGTVFESPMLPRFHLPPRNRLPASSRFVEVVGTGKPEGINRLYGRPRITYVAPSFQDAAAEARIEQAETGPRCAHAGETADIEVLTVAVRQRTAPDKMTLGLPVVDFTVQSQCIGVDGLLSESQSTHAMVAEADACRYLWEKFGINLLLLEMYQSATTPNLAWMAEHPLMTATTRQKAAQAYKGELANRLGSFQGNFSQPCVPYYELAGLLELVAHLEGDFFGLGKTSLEKPALPCGIVFANVMDQPSILRVDLQTGEMRIELAEFPASAQDDAHVIYANVGSMRDLHVVQLPGGLVGEPASQLNQIFRMRAEIYELTQRQLDVEATEDAALEDEIQNRVREVRRLYRALLPLFAKRRESIHAAQRKHETCTAAFRRSTIELEASDRWAKVPGNVEDMVPHNVLLPAGVVYSMQQSIAEGTAFVLARPNRYRSDEVTFGSDAHGQVSQEALRDALSQVFLADKGNASPWILPVGYTGLCRLYQAQGAYDHSESIVTYPVEFWRTIRPHLAKRIAEKGLRSAMNIGGCPYELFRSFMRVMSCWQYPYHVPKKDRAAKEGRRLMTGLVQIIEEGRDASGRDFVRWRFNPAQEQLVTGTRDAKPMYMAVDASAMFAHRKRGVMLGPALQFYLEWLIRCNVNRGLFTRAEDPCLLVGPNKDGITLGRICERLGIMSSIGTKRGSDHAAQRLEQALNAAAEQEGGPLVSWCFDGKRSRHDVYDSKIRITVSDHYRPFYEHLRQFNSLRSLKRELETPFAPEHAGPKKRASGRKAGRSKRPAA